MNSYRFITLDAFTTTPFAGNPCAVLPRADGLTTEQMQQIARETNLSETAFVLATDRADFRVRYFTPHHEVGFAGHPTIATAFLLAQERMVRLQAEVTTLSLEFNVGVLPVEVCSRNGAPVEIRMTQQLPTFGPQINAAELAPCLGLAAADLRDDCPIQVVSTGMAFLLAPARTLKALSEIVVDRPKLTHLLKSVGVNAVFVFSIGGFDPSADTHARMFDPVTGYEDPYTGSGAGCMGAYLVHYGIKTGPVFWAEQGHFTGRPGVGKIEINQTDGKITQVRLSGAAVKVMEGEIFIGS